MRYHYVEVKGLNVFYRECSNPDKSVLLLFHGFPSASHMFRDLMPRLSSHFHVIAPDYPGFGQTDSPSREQFAYTFDHLAEIMDAFIDVLGLKQFYMYVFDYGAPIGFRIALKHPEAILGIISQNGNVYEEGLGSKWQIVPSTGKTLRLNCARCTNLLLRKTLSSVSTRLVHRKVRFLLMVIP